MPISEHKILIVDDEPALRRALRTSLAASGFTVEEVSTGEQAIDIFTPELADLVLLDINMPGIGGLETCRRLRRLATGVGIVMVTIRDSEDDQVHALDAGADDYIVKPYRFRELLARIRAVLRRINPQALALHLRVGDLELDLEQRILKKVGAEVHLSPTEFDLMAFFFENQGIPLTHARLLRAIWGQEYGGELEYLRSYVRMLRKKIEDDPARPTYLLTEPWVGYRLVNPVESND
jgi:two-component system, OmpR family, KDP operon response regulator KdpE